GDTESCVCAVVPLLERDHPADGLAVLGEEPHRGRVDTVDGTAHEPFGAATHPDLFPVGDDPAVDLPAFCVADLEAGVEAFVDGDGGDVGVTELQLAVEHSVV